VLRTQGRTGGRLAAFGPQKPSFAILVLCLGMLMLAGCGPEWESDPDVEGARIACAGLRRVEHTTCITWEAVARQNPDVCHLSGLALDSACLQAVYRAASNPAICVRVYHSATAEECRTWYADQSTEPKAVGERRRPQGEFLEVCAQTTVRDLVKFRRILASGEDSFADLCGQLGRPDWTTGSGLIIFIYRLADGSEVWLGFGGLQELNYAIQVKPDGQKVDLLAQ
jgi:hypothetical protein